MTEWRTGRAVPGAIYRNGVRVGIRDTPELAAEVVEALNGRRRALAPAECGCPVTLASTRTVTHVRACSVRRTAVPFDDAGVHYSDCPIGCCS